MLALGVWKQIFNIYFTLFERKKEIFHLLVHSQNSHSSPGLGQAETRSCGLNLCLPVGSRDQVLEPLPAATQGAQW